MTRSRELLLVVGARPNFVKAAPVLRAVQAAGLAGTFLVHTGQHYDARLSEVFFRDLGMPEPDLYLGVGSGSHAVQTAEAMRRLEPVLVERRPAWVVVFGDVNSTVAAALTAAKLELRVAHVEAGLRSFDPAMPEEVNRRVTDVLSDLLFTTEASGDENLAREGVPAERVLRVGNTMVDSLDHALDLARSRRPAVLERLRLEPGGYAVLTLHRPGNVDDPAVLRPLLTALAEIATRLPVVFPVHPRTRARLRQDPAAEAVLAGQPRLLLSEPMGYLEFLGLLDAARLVLTDSGGIQEETTALGVTCLTLRDNTERPVTLTHGTNRLVGSAPPAVLAAVDEALGVDGGRPAVRPPLWDGHAGERIAAELARRLDG